MCDDERAVGHMAEMVMALLPAPTAFLAKHDSCGPAAVSRAYTANVLAQCLTRSTRPPDQTDHEMHSRKDTPESMFYHRE